MRGDLVHLARSHLPVRNKICSVHIIKSKVHKGLIQSKTRLAKYKNLYIHRIYNLIFVMNSLESDNATQPTSDDTPTVCSEDAIEGLTLIQKAKKTAVAISGGALVAIGIPLIPLPGPGCVVVASGLSILATEFPAAQKMLDKGKEKIRNFAEDESENHNEDDLGLGFEIVDHPNAPEKSPKNGVERLRAVTRENILPLVERLPGGKEEEKTNEQREPEVIMNSCFGMYNTLSE